MLPENQYPPFESYNHEYHQSFVYKIFLKRKNNATVYTDFEQTLDIIKKIHSYSRGMKQIIYLVGWQYEGHDSKYPAWHEVGAHLKLSQHNNALESLRWLIQEAKAFNAIVSLHINMDDAYDTSPFWNEYCKKDLINLNANGMLVSSSIWDGEVSYEISKTREWQSGMAQQRIDFLLEMIPELQAGGTIHIDAFRPKPSPGHNISLDDEINTAKEIYHYWKNAGLDVTNEFISLTEFIGYTPMVWALNLDEAGRLKYPASVICGGHGEWNVRKQNIYNMPGWVGQFCCPDAGTLYEEVWGCNAISEMTAIKSDRLPVFQEFITMLYEKTLPWYFLNQFTITDHRHTADSYEVYFADGVVSKLNVAEQHHTITQNSRMVVDGSDCLIPLSWQENELIAYSKEGGSREWELAEKYRKIKTVKVEEITSTGLINPYEIKCNNNKIQLNLLPQQAVSLKL